MDSSKVRENLAKAFERYYRQELEFPNWKHIVEEGLKRPLGQNVLRLIRHIEFKGKRVLDVGCGLGHFSISFLRKGAQVFGIDPSIDSIQVAKAWYEDEFGKSLLCVSRGEYLPFKTGNFDIVFSHFVLEHVQDVDLVIAEMLRVLKPSGVCIINAPNYLFPLEQHYRLLWIAYLPKWLAKKYLILRGRNPSFLNTINKITPLRIKKSLYKQGVSIKVDLVMDAVRNPQLLASKLWRFVARLSKYLLLPPFLVHLFSPVFSVIVERPNKYKYGKK
jgi:ubiquinone/menaquinone biosynthesis C-methylase UbiE